jgi:uncharacterized protein YerC
MAQVSKYPISKDVADRIFEVFIKSLTKIKNHKEAQDFTYDLFSPTEKIMLAKRMAIAFLLMKGYQYRNISRLLRVSSATIGSINISLKLGKGAYQTILTRIAKEEKLEKFFLDIAGKALAVMATSRKGVGWRYLRDEVHKSKYKVGRKF